MQVSKSDFQFTNAVEVYLADPVISLRDSMDFAQDNIEAYLKQENHDTNKSDRTQDVSTAVHRVVIRPHRGIAKKISDWFLLLKRFQYL